MNQNYQNLLIMNLQKIRNFSLLLLIFFFLSCNTSNNRSDRETKEQKDSSNKSESSKYAIAVNGSCSYSGELSTDKVYGFTSDNEAQIALNRIMNYTGLPVNFKLMAADVDNACAVIQQKSSGDMERYVMYNQQFMMSVEDLTHNHWAEISILAHEIGHHLSGHTLLKGGSRPDFELEADRFSGYILYKMGASLDDAQIAMKTLTSDAGSDTHPPKKSRLVAITNGWLAAKEQDNMKRPVQNTTTIPDNSNKPIETVSASKRDEIISLLNRYYRINSASQCEQLADFYTPIVDNFFNKYNESQSQIISDCIDYHNRWGYHQMNIDNSTFSITQLNDGDFFVTLDMYYLVKRKMEDSWKEFYLTQNIRFNADLKIKAIFEYQKPKL